MGLHCHTMSRNSEIEKIEMKVFTIRITF